VFYLFVVIVGVLGISIYLTVVFRAVPGALDERLGYLEDLPKDHGEWVTDKASEAGQQAASQGLTRETRVLLEPAKGLFGREQLVRQARCRDANGKIVSVEAEQRSPRRRLKK
jgi:hypothetical protein